MSKSTYWIDGPGGMRISVTVNTDDAERAVADVIQRGDDVRPAWTKIANWMRRSFARNFWEGGRPDRWKPLAESTLAAKTDNPAVVYASALGRRRIRRLAQLSPQGIPARSIHNILIAGGQLRDSAVQKNKDHVELLSKDRLEIGSKHWLSEIHQEGTKPMIIRPRRGRFLRFLTDQGMVFARMVRHPGLPARPFILAQPEDVDYAAEVMRDHVAS